MVTETQIDDLHDVIEARHQEIGMALQALRLIKLRRPSAQPTFIPINPIKFVTYTQAERDAIFADVETEIARIMTIL